ncbi:MAG TPA: thioredoxin family protein [Puia sp.]|jgi:hypothetical protein|nr:thioredoxin family protein [Puia sp.]
MNKLLFFLPTVALLTSLTIRENSLPIGGILPKADLRMKDISGREISLKEAKQAHGLMVMFICNTCPVVKMNADRVKQVCTFAAGHQVGVMLLNSNEGERDGGNSFADMQAFAKEQGFKWYYALDKNSELADAFGAARTPECFLFDKEGKLVYHGAIDDSPGDPDQVKRHHLQNAIDEVSGGKEISVKETRSIGCSIKRG